MEALKEYTPLQENRKEEERREERVGGEAEGGGKGGAEGGEKENSRKVAQVAVVVGESRGARPEEGSSAPLHVSSPTSQGTADMTLGASCSRAPARMHARLLKILGGMPLEPMLFLKMVAKGNYGVVADTLEQDRICRVNLNFSQEECDGWIHDANLSYVKVAVQHSQNLFNYNQSIMDSVLPLAVVLFAGSLSDRHGRKPPMLAVLAGFVVLAATYLVEALNPGWPVQVMYAGTLVVDMMGSWVVFNMAVYSYVADISTPETRTRRLAILDAVWYLGGPLGRLLGGWLYRLAGFAVVFAVSCALWLMCFLYTLLLVRETVDRAAPKPEVEQDLGDARWGPLRHVVALCRTTFKARPSHGRLYLLVIVVLKMAVFLVQGHLMYQWAQNVLRWGAAEYSTWSSVDSVVHQVGMVAWTWVAARAGLHDALVAAGGVVSIGLWSAILASITQPDLWWMAAVATVAGMLEPCMEPALRTLLTTEVGEGEAGRVLALMGLVEAAWFLADRSIYTFLYNAFFTVFPQINLVVQAGLCVPLLLAMLLLWRALRNRAASTYDLPHQE